MTDRTPRGDPMMTDPLSWSPISLGRWGGTRVRAHFLLVAFVVVTLVGAAVGSDHRLVATAAWLGLLVAALAVHEFGHAAMASWLGAEPEEEVRLWPLGNLVGPSPARSHDSVLVACAGPLANLLMVVAAAVGLGMLDAQFVWRPFGNPGDSGAPYLNALKPPGLAPPFTPAWWVGWFGYLNWVLLIANLIPALPFDGGRALRGFMASSPMVGSRDTLIAPWLARSFALILVIGGLIRLLRYHTGDGLTLIGLAILIEGMVRAEARMTEEGGFFDDGVFGYDFSEGYTSLEGSAAKVRPYRESALKRWRRRRSELRRQRREEREMAEDSRMDEILDKLHREGRPALTEEEHRFLVRVSSKFRNRPRA